MSEQITDTTGQPLLYVNLRLEENTDSLVVVARVPCSAGRYLASEASDSAQVFARRTGSGAAFVDIAADPMSLTPWAGETVEFDFKVQAGSVAGLARVALPVRVTYQP